LSTAPRGTLIGLAGIVGFHRAAIIIWFESPVVVDSESLLRALRDLERSVNFMGRILNRPLDEFLNDDEAVYAITP
jgi:uridine kinase